MIEQLISLIKKNAGDEIINNPAIPDAKNEEAIQDVGRNLIDGLKDQVSQGNIQGLMSIFNNADISSLTKNPVVGQLIAKVTDSLAGKFGIAPQAARQISEGILPRVLGQFASKAKDPNDKDFDLQDIVKNLAGNSNVNAGDLLGSLMGSEGKGGLGSTIGKLFG